jgi:hypothetical protein
MSIAAALLFSAGAAFAEEPDTVAVEPGTGEQEPEVIYHRIVPRDTLWDISEYYLKDPFKWPNVWKINPFIDNPHLIYPGDTVRLTPGGVQVLAPDDIDKEAEGLGKVGLEPSDETLVLEPEPGAEAAPAPAPKAAVVRDHAMARSGFVTETEFQASGAIIGPEEKKILMNSGDKVFVSFKEKEGIDQGSRYTIYNVGRKIKHPDTGRTIDTR